MNQPRKICHSSTIDKWCVDVRANLKLLWISLLDSAQRSIGQDCQARHWFGLEMADLDGLLAASESKCETLASRCPHPFRPARKIHDIFSTHQTSFERTKMEILKPATVAELRIMWSGYLLRLQWLTVTYPETWLLCGLTEDDATLLRDTPALTIQRAVMRGPYTFVSSLTLRGLLSAKRPLPQSERLHCIAADINARSR